MFYIYKITNIINNKIYIGKTNDVKYRWKKHLQTAKSGKYNRPLYNSINKYGKDNFTIETIDEYELESEAFLAETCYILYYKSNDLIIGMNLTIGGEGPNGMKHSEETKQHLSIVCSGYKHTEETLKIISAAHKGKIVSPDTLEKMRQANLGKKHTQETKDKMSKSRKGTKLGAENHSYGTHLSDEEKEHLRQMMIGENSPRALFTREQIIEIREKYKSGNYILKDLANEYNVSISCIYQIVSGKRYSNIN